MSAKRSEFELDERAAEARFILSNPIFQEAINELRERYIKQMMVASIGSDQATSSHAKLVVIEEVIAELSAVVTDQKMASQRRPNYGN